MVTTLLVVIVLLQLFQLVRVAQVESRVELHIKDLRAIVDMSLRQKQDLQAWVRERIAQRVTEWKSGGGRERLRARMQARQASRGAVPSDAVSETPPHDPQ